MKIFTSKLYVCKIVVSRISTNIGEHADTSAVGDIGERPGGPGPLFNISHLIARRANKNHFRARPLLLGTGWASPQLTERSESGSTGSHCSDSRSSWKMCYLLKAETCDQRMGFKNYFSLTDSVKNYFFSWLCAKFPVSFHDCLKKALWNKFVLPVFWLTCVSKLVDWSIGIRKKSHLVSGF